MNPLDIKNQRFSELAALQRDKPEKAMDNLQAVTRGGLLGWGAEHIGDLTHRMSEHPEWNSPSGYDKVEKTLKALQHPYGFEKESWEQIARNKVDPETVKHHMNLYADEHAKLPVYNRAHWLGREAAVNYGRGNFPQTIKHLKELHGLGEEGYKNLALSHTVGPDGNLQQYSPEPENIELPKQALLNILVKAAIGEEKDFFTNSDGGGVADSPQKTFGPEFINNELMPMEGVELAVNNDPRPTNEADEIMYQDPDSVTDKKSKTPEMNKGRTFASASDIHLISHGTMFAKSARELSNQTPYEMFNKDKNSGSQFDNVPYLDNAGIIDQSFNSHAPSKYDLSPGDMGNVSETMYPDENIRKQDMSRKDFGTGDQSSEPAYAATAPYTGNLD
ncbi:MAG TPA: hypothetical protein VIH61_01315, partial [Waddliaceae bacterium]